MSREIERERAQIRELEDLLSQGKITRRDFLGRATALGVAVTVATSMWGSSAVAATPKPGGTLRQALRGGATSDSLEGGTLLDTHNINTSWQVRNNLTEVTNTGELIGELAESWEPNDDASVWTFRLRKGVEFHNGKTLDAEDVIDTLNQHRGEDSKSAAKAIMNPVKDLQADGANTVVITLEEGNADFPFMVADYHLTIAPSGTRGKEWDKGIGTGPFVLTDWEPGVRSATKRNPKYFKEGQPYFDGVESLNIGDQTARTNALRTGDVDAMEDPDLKTLHLLERIPGMKVLEAGGTKHYSIPMRTDTAPFDDNNVRLALKHAVDRNVLLKTILRGRGYLGNDHPIGRPQRFFASDIPQREYDLDKARFHLKEAGLSNLTVQLSAADIYAGATDAAVLYKEQAAAAGINIEVVREPTDGYWANVWLQKPWCMCYWSGRATEDWMFATAYSEGAEWNDTYWKHERFNQLLKQARGELDNNRRGEMYAECQQIVRDEGGVVIPLFANFIAVVDEKLGTPEKIAGNWAMDGDKNHERWWFV